MASRSLPADGVSGWRYRIYGAMVVGMLANALAKAEGASFEMGVVVMLVVMLLGATLGGACLTRTLFGRLARKRTRSAP